MDDVQVRIEEIYVPAKRRTTLDAERVEALAEDILENGLQVPINVRRDEDAGRYVLVEGLHRLEACRALGDEEITAIIVRARLH